MTSTGSWTTLANCGLVTANILIFMMQNGSIAPPTLPLGVRDSLRGMHPSLEAAVNESTESIIDRLVERKFESLQNKFDVIVENHVSSLDGAVSNVVEKHLKTVDDKVDDFLSRKSRHLQWDPDAEWGTGAGEVNLAFIDPNMKCYSTNNTCHTSSKYIFGNDVELERGQRIRADLAQVRSIENMLGKSVIATDKEGLRAFGDFRLNSAKVQALLVTDLENRPLFFSDEGVFRVSANLRVSGNKRVEIETLAVQFIEALDALDVLRVSSNMRMSSNKKLEIETLAVQDIEALDLDLDVLRVSSNMRMSGNKRLETDTLGVQGIEALNGTDVLRVSSNMRMSGNKRLTVETLQFLQGDEPDDLNGTETIDIDPTPGVGLRVSSNMRMSGNKRFVAPVAKIETLDVTLEINNGTDSNKTRRLLGGLAELPSRYETAALTEALNPSDTRQVDINIKVNDYFQSQVGGEPSDIAGYTRVPGIGRCIDSNENFYDHVFFNDISGAAACAAKCSEVKDYTVYVGLGWEPNFLRCYCYYENFQNPPCNTGCDGSNEDGSGNGAVVGVDDLVGTYCFSFDEYPKDPPDQTGFEFVGFGWCLNIDNYYYDFASYQGLTLEECAAQCDVIATCAMVGFEHFGQSCFCDFEAGQVPSGLPGQNGFYNGVGAIASAGFRRVVNCFENSNYVGCGA